MSTLVPYHIKTVYTVWERTIENYLPETRMYHAIRQASVLRSVIEMRASTS